MNPLLVLDCHYLCYRSFHVAGHLSWEGRGTGVIFGFLKSLAFFKDEFQTDRIVFCFEGRSSRRKAIYPEYKQGRRKEKMTLEERKAYEGLSLQINELRGRYLPEIGFRNVLCYEGYESDDVMAVIAQQTGEYEEGVILITSDSDLYQCLRPNVSIYSPQKMRLLTNSWFRQEYGIPPWKWALVKALSGCHSDNVAGIRGIGELTALRFIRGELDEKSKAYQSILSEEGRRIVRRNKRLVKLPFDGCPVPEVKEDQVSREAWWKVCKSLGFRSIAGQPPVYVRRLSQT